MFSFPHVLFCTDMEPREARQLCLADKRNEAMPNPRILLVDDNESIRISMQQVLEVNGFEVVAASGVNDALRHIAAGPFDVLLSDLHMPERGDGLTVVSAMRHAHPKAVTLVYSGYPEMQAATAAILLQADQVLLKPMDIPD